MRYNTTKATIKICGTVVAAAAAVVAFAGGTAAHADPTTPAPTSAPTVSPASPDANTPWG